MKKSNRGECDDLCAGLSLLSQPVTLSSVDAGDLTLFELWRNAVCLLGLSGLLFLRTEESCDWRRCFSASTSARRVKMELAEDILESPNDRLRVLSEFRRPDVNRLVGS